jgi:uncharacterized membrane protein
LRERSRPSFFVGPAKILEQAVQPGQASSYRRGASDKKLDFWPAMEVSRQVVTRHWWSMFLFAIVLLLIICLGALACGFGLILAVPVVFAALSFVYEDLFGTKAAAPAQVTP